MAKRAYKKKNPFTKKGKKNKGAEISGGALGPFRQNKDNTEDEDRGTDVSGVLLETGDKSKKLSLNAKLRKLVEKHGMRKVLRALSRKSVYSFK